MTGSASSSVPLPGVGLVRHEALARAIARRLGHDSDSPDVQLIEVALLRAVQEHTAIMLESVRKWALADDEPPSPSVYVVLYHLTRAMEEGRTEGGSSQ